MLKFVFTFIILFLFLTQPVRALVFNTPLTISLQVKPGDKITGKIVLTNDRDTPEIVNLRQVDYRYNSQGESFFEEPGTLLRSNARWVELSCKQVSMLPRETKEILYLVRVPLGHHKPSSYSSTILVEPESFASKIESPENGNISLNIKIRYAHQIITTIGSPQATLKVIARSVDKRDDGYYFNADVANCGECYLYPKATLKLFNITGQITNCYELAPCSILPDNSVRFSFKIENLNQKQSTGFLLLDDGNDHLFVEKLAITTN